jgi:hypothetical protein
MQVNPQSAIRNLAELCATSSSPSPTTAPISAAGKRSRDFARSPNRFEADADGSHQMMHQVAKAIVSVPPANDLPAILAGHATPDVEQGLDRFYCSLPEILEAFLSRCQSPHTRRAYRQDLKSFFEFAGITWTEETAKLPRPPGRPALPQRQCPRVLRSGGTVGG